MFSFYFQYSSMISKNDFFDLSTIENNLLPQIIQIRDHIFIRS